jgi:outer membrane lipoprotein-sorting protein
MNISARSMSRNFTIAVLAIGVLTAFTASDALEALQEKFQAGGVFRAEMDHSYRDSFTGETTVTKGTIWLAKDGYKVETADQTILVHKGTSRVYNRSRKQLILSDYHPEEDDFAPSRFFDNDGGAFTATDRVVEGRTSIQIKFTDPFDLLRSATIQIGTGGMPLSIAAEDQADNRMTTRFNSGRFQADSIGVFRINLPAGIELIDLREN